RRQRFGHLQVEVGRLQRQAGIFGADQHIAEDRDGVAALDHAMDVAQRFQQLRAFDGDLHCITRQRWKSRAAGRRAAALETRKAGSGTDLIKPPGGPQGGADGAPVQGRQPPVPHFCGRKWRAEKNSPAPGSGRERLGGAKSYGKFCSCCRYSCNCRFSDSTSSDSAVSRATRASILRTACSTVVWSRPPKRRPISGSERSVSVLARYIATCRGRTTLAVRREDKRSERLTLYCRATTRWMSSILIRFGSCGRIRSRTSRSAISSVTGWLLSLEWASRRLMAPSRSRPLWVMVRAR